MNLISYIVGALIMMETAVLYVCWLAAGLFLSSTFLRQINIRQELRAKEYLFMINRNVFFLIRGLVDFEAMYLVYIACASNLPIIFDHPQEKHCSEFSINDCQQYIQYMLVGISSLAILDCLIVLCAVGRLTKTDIVSTLLGYYLPFLFFGLIGLYSSRLSASKYEDVVTICYRQDHSAAMFNQQVGEHIFFQRFNSFVFFFFICALVHAAHSYFTRQAAEMAVSIFKDSKTEVAKDKADVLEPSDVTWIQTELDKECTTGLFSDDENIRMWRKYFLSSNKAEMCVPSHCESFCRFSPVQARLYLGLILYFACIIGVYYYTVNFFDNSELRNFTFLIFTTLLTINSVIRVAVVAAVEGLKEEANYRKIYKKDIFECFTRMYHSLRR